MTDEKEESAAAGQPGRACDFCGSAAARAVVYCRADAAGLCLACDRHVHAANSVSSKHPRSPLCDCCLAAPAAIFCGAHRRVLCANCDFDAHQGGGRDHGRRPVEPFSGCPPAAELAAALGVGGAGGGGKEKGKEVVAPDWGLELEEEEGFGVWETQTVFSLEDLIVPTTSWHGFQAMGIPPLPKNRNLVCGKQKEEILRQLRQLISSETDLSNDYEEVEPVTDFQSIVPQQNLQQENLGSDFDQGLTFNIIPNCEDNMLQWDLNESHQGLAPVPFLHSQQTGSSSALSTSFPDNIAHTHLCSSPASGGAIKPMKPFNAENQSPLQPKSGVEIVCPDRDSVISRYKEKRKTRRYDKLIRYESRKVRADSRIRINGRFAKVNQLPRS